jgi:catechol 2,3-dioxygenase-like lactoylglutathione lyase family enzyme
MKARITLITLGVDDLARSLAFYGNGLGFPTKGIVGTEFEHGAVAFFDLQPGLQLAIWPRADLAHDAGLPRGQPSATELSLGHNVNSQEEVDAVMEQASRAGARIVKPAQATFWGGYAGYFQDPDGHLWEVAWNPALVVQEP